MSIKSSDRNFVRRVQESAADPGICNTADGAGKLQTLPYGNDELVLIAPTGQALCAQGAIHFEAALNYDQVGLHSNNSIYLAMRAAAAVLGCSVMLRIHVTRLDAMCRMIPYGLGLVVMPQRAFEMMHGGARSSRWRCSTAGQPGRSAWWRAIFQPIPSPHACWLNTWWRRHPLRPPLKI